MKLTLLIVKMLIAIYHGQACQVGTNTPDYYGWMDANPDYVVVKVFETPSHGDYWLVKDSHDGNDYELIAFWDDISDNIYYTSVFHVRCFRRVGQDG